MDAHSQISPEDLGETKLLLKQSIDDEDWKVAKELIKDIVSVYQGSGQWDTLMKYQRIYSEVGESIGDLEMQMKGKADELGIRVFFSKMDSTITQEKGALYRLIDTSRLSKHFAATMMMSQGVLFFEEEKYDSCKSNIQLAIRFADEADDVNLRAIIRLEAADLYRKDGDFKGSMNVLLEAERLSEHRLIDGAIRIRVFRALCRLFTKIEDYDKAIFYADKGLTVAKDFGYDMFYNDALHDKGIVKFYQGDFAEARSMLNEASGYYQKKEMQHRTVSILKTKAGIAAADNDRVAFAAIIDSIQAIRPEQGVLEDLLIGEEALETQDFQQVASVLERLESSTLGRYNKRTRKLEAEFAKANGNYKLAVEKLEEYYAIKDSTLKANQTLQTYRLESEFNRKEQDAEIKGLNEISVAQEKALAVRNTALIMGSIMLLVLAALLMGLYKLYQRNQENQTQLAAQNTQISNALADNQMLIKEIHHRVKNNLQVISSLLSMQERKVTDSDTKDALKSSKTRVQSMSILHQSLYQTDKFKDVEAEQYIARLVDNIRDTYNTDSDLKFHIDIDPISLDVDTLIPLGLISNELICNAMKYAFEGREVGTIKYKLKESDKHITMTVSDDGVGIGAEEIPQKESSLGARLIKSFSDRLDGNIKVSSDSGTTIEITFDKDSLM